ncbi:MAG: radical SAM protein [Acidimicrobiia bacterium]|nr:radical SAM protein [Acidimicrobiia bacterium]
MQRDLDDIVRLGNGYTRDGNYPFALVNVTNRCNLSCPHCFVFRDDNPNLAVGARREPDTDEILEALAALRDRHGIGFMLWMGGEPLLRRDLLVRGVQLFPHNHVVTNGTIPLVELGPDTLYIVSLDGPEDVNDIMRGEGTYRRVMRMLDRLPDGLSTPVQVQCTVTPANQGRLGELVAALQGTRVGWMTFSFVVPAKQDETGLVWGSLEERMSAVEEVARLKAEYPEFVRNRSRALELMSPENAPAVTAACLTKKLLLPLWLDGDHFTTPYCCYGDDVDCSRCGAWVVFDMAARMEASAGPRAG